MSSFSLLSKILFFSAATLISVSATPQPGSVDPTFDPGRGPLHVEASRGNSVLIQSDGKILVTGESNGVNLDFVPAVVRFNSDGSLDGSFNAAALPASGSFAPDDLAKLLALQPNGQILVAGKFANSDGSARPLTRLNGDGSLDAAFNPRIEDSSGVATVRQAQVLADGRILIGGRFNRINGISRSSPARLNADGSLDETFNATVASSLFVVQSTGKIVVVSFGNQLVRLNPDGSVDHTFTSPIGSPNVTSSGLLVQPDDKLIWTIIHEGFIPEYQTTIRRLNADGTNDPDFQPFSSLGGFALLVQSDGKIVVRVLFTQGPSRLNSDGSPDESFKPQALGYSVAQQSDGKLITVGDLYDGPYGIRRMFLDGSRDDTFAPELGLTRIGHASIDQARLLPNGKIAIAGKFNYIDRVLRKGIAVLNNDGTLDPNFDAGDLLVLSPYTDTAVSVLVTQVDGKILLGFERHLVRLNPDGQLDDTFQYVPTQQGYFESIGLQPDGKIILQRGGDGLVRLNRDGSVDSTFQLAQQGHLALVQPNGKILIYGVSRLHRLNADGSLDSSFDASDSAGFLPPRVLALQTDGKLLVNRFISSLQPYTFIRLNANGSIDSTFQPDIATAGVAAVDQSGIFISTTIGPGGTTTAPSITHLFPDGRRDPNFVATFNPGAALNSILIQPDGQLIVTGNFAQVNGVERNAIARLHGSAPKKLANISTRARVGRAESVEIGGFIITGNAPKKVILRAIGPSLESNGILESDILVNPSLELRDASGALIAHNDDWRGAQETEITASGIPPAANAEAAIVRTLAPGHYTAVVQGSDGGEGIALVEVYDLDLASDSRLANISTRGSVQESDGVMIAGFILQGSESSTIALRALGPSLASSGVTGALADPTLTLYNHSGSIVAENDDWKQTQEAELAALGLGSTSESDSAMVATLAPGSYTAVVRGANGQSGVGLVEVYHLE